VHLRHGGVGDDAQRVCERGLVLAREADDDVGGEVEVAEGLEAAQEGGRLVAARHRAEDAVVARLQRHVQVLRHRGGLAQGGDELAVDVVDLDRREAQPGETGELAELANQPREPVAGLAVAVAAEIDAGEDDLAVVLRHAPPCLANDGRGRATA
jgi:hypothetical protein